jgi:uncharacterized membrane protein YhfC
MERVSAMLIHVACSILVFYAVTTPTRRWMFPLAILLHAFVDFFAALYQVGKISISLAIFEVLLFLIAVVFFCLALRLVYHKMPEN